LWRAAIISRPVVGTKDRNGRTDARQITRCRYDGQLDSRAVAFRLRQQHARKRDTRVNTELRIDAPDVLTDDVSAEREPLSDLAIGKALPDERGDFGLGVKP
jgi:hypothetical protein